MFQRVYDCDTNYIKTAVFGACYEEDGSLNREAQNGYLLPQVVAIAAPPAIAFPELVVLTEEQRKLKYSDIYRLAQELCCSTAVLPEKEKEIQEMTEERLREKLVQDFDLLQEHRRKAFYLPLDQRRSLLKYLDLVADALLQFAEIEDEWLVCCNTSNWRQQ